MTQEERMRRHAQERARAIETMERALGKDAVVPLSLAAAVLPANPEWETYCRKKRPRKKGGAA